MTYGGKPPLVEGADVRVVLVAVIVTDIVRRLHRVGRDRWGGVEVRLREAQGPVVLETVEDVRDELGGRRVKPYDGHPRRWSAACWLLRLGVAAHPDPRRCTMVVRQSESPSSSMKESDPEPDGPRTSPKSSFRDGRKVASRLPASQLR